MNILKLFKKKPQIRENGSFAEFFRTASQKEQIKVLTQAARLANEDQRKLMKEVGVK
jgi:hypothetical protein